MRKFHLVLGSLLFGFLSATGQVNILSENFNGAAAGWTKINNSTGATPALADWTLQPDGYHYVSVFLDETFHSNDNSQFILTNSDAQGDDVPSPTTETILRSPTFATTGYSSVTLQFYHNFSPASASDAGTVEVSTDGTIWTSVATYLNLEGTSSSFVQKSISLSAYIGNAAVYVRFRYNAVFGNYWAIDNVTITGTPIVTPVSLVAFSGYREGNHNLLKWSTASEQDNKGFQVERSTNGVSYSSIGFVNSKASNGNSSSLLLYNFHDDNLSGTKQYYRLRQIDIDNREKLSNIIVIKGQRPSVLHFGGLFPNPATDRVNIIVEVPDAALVDLRITDMFGRMIKKQSWAVEAGTNTIPLDVSHFVNGTYSIQCSCKNFETVTARFIKQ